MILNIMGLWGNFQTDVMIVGHSHATHWELVGNMWELWNMATHAIHIRFESNGCMHLPFRMTNNMNTHGDLTDGSPDSAWAVEFTKQKYSDDTRRELLPQEVEP